MSINMVYLTGRPDAAVELKQSANSKPYARFAFISTRYDKNDTATESARVHCVAFGALAERIAENSGCDMFIAGRLKTESYNAPDGSPRESLKLMVDEAKVFGGATTAPATVREAPKVAHRNVPATSNDTPPF